MNLTNRVNRTKAQKEFDHLVQIYRDLGLNVEILAAQPGLPDMVYAANHGFVIDDIFIKSSFRYPQRRKEADHAEDHFRNNHNSPNPSGRTFRGNGGSYRIEEIPKGVFFEGQGDLFYRDGKFFFGYGKRSSKDAIHQLKKILRDDILTFEVNDPYFYHLDTCFAPLGRGKVVINPASFNKKDLGKIKKNFKKVIITGKQDNSVMCCNLVAIGDTIVIGEGVSSNLKKTLTTEGFKTIETEMGEFLKGGGSVKCLTLEFFSSAN